MTDKLPETVTVKTADLQVIHAAYEHISNLQFLCGLTDNQGVMVVKDLLHPSLAKFAELVYDPAGGLNWEKLVEAQKDGAK